MNSLKLEDKPKYDWRCEHRDEGAEHDNGCGQSGVLSILFGEDKINDRGGKRAVKEQNLAVGTFGSDHQHRDVRGTEPTDYAHQRAADRMSPLERLHFDATGSPGL